MKYMETLESVEVVFKDKKLFSCLYVKIYCLNVIIIWLYLFGCLFFVQKIN